jgi:hypothetical protein
VTFVFWAFIVPATVASCYCWYHQWRLNKQIKQTVEDLTGEK